MELTSTTDADRPCISGSSSYSRLVADRMLPSTAACQSAAVRSPSEPSGGRENALCTRTSTAP